MRRLLLGVLILAVIGLSAALYVATRPRPEPAAVIRTDGTLTNDFQTSRGCGCKNSLGETSVAGCGCSVEQCRESCLRQGAFFDRFVENPLCTVFSCQGSTATNFQVKVETQDVKNGDPPQCIGGIQSAVVGAWTRPVVLRTDGHQGGCLQSFAIQDPQGLLGDFRLTVDQQGMPGADPGQCFRHQATLGARVISPSPPGPGGFSNPFAIDTDNRPGGCLQTYSVSGTNTSYALEIQHWPEFERNKGQCGTKIAIPESQSFQVKPGESVTQTLDMDFQEGCAQRFRIVKFR
jgi:hypothetical protein